MGSDTRKDEDSTQPFIQIVMGHGGSKMLANMKKRKAKRNKRIIAGTGPAGTVFRTKKPITTA